MWSPPIRTFQDRERVSGVALPPGKLAVGAESAEEDVRGEVVEFINELGLL